MREYFGWKGIVGMEATGFNTRANTVINSLEKTVAPLLLTAEQARTLCSLSKSAWYKALANGKIPSAVRIGGALRWRRDELLDWIAAGCPPRVKWEKVYGQH